MNKILNEDLIYLVLEAVSEIPYGKVCTYGDIARLIGRPKNARLVGKVLSVSEYFGEYPCHRVVNFNGRIAPSFPNQKKLLENEGVKFKDVQHVDIKKYKWNI